MGGFNDVWDGLWFVPQHEVKQGFASSGVGVVIVDKFCHGNMICPSFRVSSRRCGGRV